MLTVGLIYNLKKKTFPKKGRKSAIRSLNGDDADRYLEWDDPGTIEAIGRAIGENYKVIMLEADKSLAAKLKKYRKELDIVFNLAEGASGSWREAIVPMMLEELGIPYTGSDPETLMLCLNKERTKQILAYHQVNYPLYKVYPEVPELTNPDIYPLEFPLIVKPLYEGSSKGIRNSSLVINSKQCQNEIARIIQLYQEPAIIEEFIPGREFTVGILGNGEDLLVLPLVEINFTSLPQGVAPIYSYEAKWVWDVPQSPLDIFHCPAEITPLIEKRIRETALNAFKALDCRDWCRIDIRLDKQDKPYVLELNPIPGILPDPNSNSCFPKAARAYGWNYSQLINVVLSITCKRYGIKNERACSCSV